MKTLPFGFLLVMTIAIGGCATSPVFLIAKTDQAPHIVSFYDDGRPVAVSHRENSTVSVTGEVKGSEIWLKVYYANASEDRFDVIPTEVRALGIDDFFVMGFPLKTQEPYQYMRRMRNQQSAILALHAFSAAVNTASSSSDVALAIRQQTAEQSLRFETLQMDAIARTTEGGLLRRNTLFPGDAVVGYIVIRGPERSGNRLNDLKFPPPLTRVTVPVGKDIHEFEFAIISAGQ
jgi:hypothetical protein